VKSANRLFCRPVRLFAADPCCGAPSQAAPHVAEDPIGAIS
jgi:hypothetical protein